MKKAIIFAALIILTTISYLYIVNINHSKMTEYIYYEVKKGDIINEVTATGTINAFQTVDVGTQVSGIVSEIYVDYNDYVKQGQVIAMIDTIALAASVTEAEANYLKVNVQFLQQEKEYNRDKELLESKVIPQNEFDVANANYLSAKSTLKSEESQLNRARINLQYATIKAPISGIVISKNVNVGQTVAANFSTPTLFTIANDLKRMQLQAKVDEADIGHIVNGQPVKFSVDAYPGISFEGVVEQIRLQPVSIQNVVNYNVMINVPNPDLRLLPGMTANLSIQVEKHKDVTIVPLAAIFFTPDFYEGSDISELKSTLWKYSINKEDGSYKVNDVFYTPVSFKRGLDNGSFVEIISAEITEGMKIIVGIKEIEISKSKKSPFDGPNNDPMED